MRIHIGQGELELVEGDITQQNTEGIVNAANPSLLGGGGVDGAIHRAGGPQILAECRRLGGCETGDAKITTAGRLEARYVIHTVGPVYYREGPQRAATLLIGAYRRSLEVAAEHGVHSLAFPSISTGAYGYPIEEAAPLALRTAIEYLQAHDEPVRLVRFVLFGRSAYDVYKKALGRILEQQGEIEESSR